VLSKEVKGLYSLFITHSSLTASANESPVNKSTWELSSNYILKK
jgi:hypothetical protein